MGEQAHGFLLLCDKELEEEVSKLATTLRSTSGLITLKTLESVEEARGASIDKQLENILKVYAHAVVIITSKNFANFIDKRNKSQCPDLLLDKYKDCISVLKKFMEGEMKKPVHKLILVSINGDTTVPNALTGMPVLENKGNDKAFVNNIISNITAKLSSSS